MVLKTGIGAGTALFESFVIMSITEPYRVWKTCQVSETWRVFN